MQVAKHHVRQGAVADHAQVAGFEYILRNAAATVGGGGGGAPVEQPQQVAEPFRLFGLAPQH
jgi:hypothetical protein